MSKFGFGQSVKRVEDARLIVGKGQYTDDISVDGQTYGYVLRSPMAHAKIKAIDVAAAKAAPGVLLVVTGADLDAVGANNLPCLVPMQNADGSSRADPGRPILATDTVRFVGDHVAFIVAETYAQAKDASELIEVDYEGLPAVTDTAAALAAGQPLVHADAANNVCFDWLYGEKAVVDAAFAKADKIVALDLINNRVVANAMEPRACVANWDVAASKMTMHACTQGGWMFKDLLSSHVLKIPAEQIRVVTPDVGGGFGMKAFFYPEYGMAAWASRAISRPVKWTGERGETFLSDVMGRDHVTHAELAFDKDKKIVGMRVATTANMGAYLSMFAPFIPTFAALKVLPGVYDVKTISYEVKGVFTHSTPVDAYRGAGRPESIYCVERLINAAALEFGIDATELRRLNFIKPEQMPFKTAVGELYDTGEFARVMDAAMAKADWQGFGARKAQSKAHGKQRGLGMCYYIESTMGDPEESAALKFEGDGTVSVWVGTQTNGQGHETAYAQVLADKLDIPFEKIRVRQGDTDMVKKGGGTGGSRSLTAQGVAVRGAAEVLMKKGTAFAAEELETAVADVEYREGTFSVKGTDKGIDLFDLAAKVRTKQAPAGFEGTGLDTDATIKLDAWTFPNGCHIAEVEIDADTGVTDVVRYTVIDDFGKVLNPMLVAGQVHGGVAQGIGQALYEQTVYGDNGQLLTGSFMDYCMPRADNMPQFDTDTLEVLCKNNEMGVKGCGEAGSVGACAAVMNAVLDATWELGVRHVDMPATPEVLWRLMHEGTAKAA